MTDTRAGRATWNDDTQAVATLREVERSISATTGWNTSTAAIRAIGDHLRTQEAQVASQSPTAWIIADGGQVSIGSRVALDISPDAVGVIEGVHPHLGLPAVRITRGPGVGGVIYPYPGQMLTRLHDR